MALEPVRLDAASHCYGAGGQRWGGEPLASHGPDPGARGTQDPPATRTTAAAHGRTAAVDSRFPLAWRGGLRLSRRALDLSADRPSAAAGVRDILQPQPSLASAGRTALDTS